MPSGPDSQKPNPLTVSFKCTKCSSDNETPIDQKELLFGGTGTAETGQRPISAAGTVRSFIVRCRNCNQAHRISVDLGSA